LLRGIYEVERCFDGALRCRPQPETAAEPASTASSIDTSPRWRTNPRNRPGEERTLYRNGQTLKLGEGGGALQPGRSQFVTKIRDSRFPIVDEDATREGLDRVKERVRDLRTFSRLDEGEFSTVDVVETIDAVLLLLRHTINGLVRVERDYSPARSLYCYAGRLHQVLMNLIGNAVDAVAGKSAGKGTGEGTVVITTSQTPKLFLISVRDTFFATKPIGQGTGLGLAISYGIVQDHGGSIEVQSEEGVGAEFIVRIPLDLELQRRHPNEERRPPEAAIG
jgi:signal transduction histidine kinase